MKLIHKLLIALRLKKEPQPKIQAPAAVVAPRSMPGAAVSPRLARSAPAHTPPRSSYVAHHQAAPSPAPAPDTSNDLAAMLLLHSMLNSSSQSHPQECSRNDDPPRDRQ